MKNLFGLYGIIYENLSLLFYIDMIAASAAMLVSQVCGVGTMLYVLNPGHTLSPTESKIVSYIVQSTTMMYRWFLVTAYFDRYALSSTNLRLRIFSRIYIAHRVIAMTVVIWIVLPVHNLIYSTTTLCKNGCVYNTPMLYYHSIFTIITGCILPASMMIIWASLIYRNLVLRQKRRQVMVIQPKGKEKERKRDRQVLMLLISQVVVFVIITIPLMISYFYNAATLNITNKSVEWLAIEQFGSFVIRIIIYIFPVLSFYLYTLTSSMFRGEFVSMMRSVLRCVCLTTTNRIEPMENNNAPRTAIVAGIKI
jgi:hypothetical protein